MEKTPESSHEKQAEAIKALDDFRSYIETVENSAHYVDLNRKSGEEKEIKGDLELSHTILQVDKLTRMKSSLGSLLEFLPEESKNEAEGLFLKADLYLAAHDKEEELARKNIVMVRSLKPVTTETLLKEMEELNLTPVSIETLMRAMDYSKAEIDEAKVKFKGFGFDLTPEDEREEE